MRAWSGVCLSVRGSNRLPVWSGFYEPVYTGIYRYELVSVSRYELPIWGCVCRYEVLSNCRYEVVSICQYEVESVCRWGCVCLQLFGGVFLLVWQFLFSSPLIHILPPSSFIVFPPFFERTLKIKGNSCEHYALSPAHGSSSALLAYGLRGLLRDVSQCVQVWSEIMF